MLRVTYKQRGIALITVLMVFAIATLIATKVIVSKNIDTQRVSGMVNRTQAYYYALAAEQLAIMALDKDDEEDGADGDNLEEPWASPAIPFDIDLIGQVVVRIIDLNRFYNLNNLIQDDGEVNEQELERFRQLLVELDLDEELAENVKDWLDEDDKESGYLSESEAYGYFEPGYVAANQAFTDLSELRLVNGFTPDVMQLLAPHLTVVPGWGVLPLNVNTATDYALTTLQKYDRSRKVYEGITQSGARNIESNRPYTSITEYNNIAPVSSPTTTTSVNPDSMGRAPDYLQARLSHFTTISDHFEINIRATYAGHVSYLTTVVKKATGNSGPKYEVINRRETDNSQRFLR